MIGGGNTAVEEALFLTNFATKVTLVHRRDELRAEKILQDRLFQHPKIETIWFHVARRGARRRRPEGRDRRAAARRARPASERVVPCDGVFVAIGHAPASQLVEGQLETHHGGYVVTKPGSTATSIPGVFAAGDIADPIYRQAVTSAGMGCMAALDAERFLAAAEATPPEAAVAAAPVAGQSPGARQAPRRSRPVSAR